MKTFMAFFIFLMAAGTLDAGNLFREVTVFKDAWEVTFYEQGARYRIEINGIDRGTSGYLQRLRLLPSDTLRLIDKHWHMDIEPIEKEGRRGIQITRPYQDRLTGETKTEITFEPIHKPVENPNHHIQPTRNKQANGAER